MDNKGFNLRLHDLRKSKKLTQSQVADALGMKLNTYSHLELNGKRPKPEILQKLSEIFCVPISEITGNDESISDFIARVSPSPVLKFTDVNHVVPEQPSYLRDLSTAEQDIVLHYRLLPFDEKLKVQKYIKKVFTNNKQPED